MKLPANPFNTGSVEKNWGFWQSWFYDIWVAATQGFGAAAGSQTLGQALLSGGSVTVTSKAVTTNCLIQVTYAGTLSNPGVLTVDTLVPGTSFRILSTNASDASHVNWLIAQPL